MWQLHVICVSCRLKVTITCSVCVCFMLCMWQLHICMFQVMYVTATSPYIFMTILLIKNSTLEGASEGVEFYLKPNMSRLEDTKVSQSESFSLVIEIWQLKLPLHSMIIKVVQLFLFTKLLLSCLSSWSYIFVLILLYFFCHRVFLFYRFATMCLIFL